MSVASLCFCFQPDCPDCGDPMDVTTMTASVMTEAVAAKYDRNCLSYWFPKLVAAGVPVPRTKIVQWPGHPWSLSYPLNGEPAPPELDGFIADLKAAALRISPVGPWFLRTGQGSGKHEWSKCCHLTDLDKILNHVCGLVEWSHLVDFLGLRHDVWVVREFLPTRPVAVLPRYHGFPLVPEVRAFIRGGRVVCHHDYWPAGAVQDGLPRGTDAIAAGEVAAAASVRGLALDDALRLATVVARAFESDGAWSVDLLPTDRGWHVTDMAEAARSFHFPGCPEEKGLAK